MPKFPCRERPERQDGPVDYDAEVMMVWREHDRREWSVWIEQALRVETEMVAPPPARLDPFSLVDPTSTERILETAGFVNASFTDVNEPVYWPEEPDTIDPRGKRRAGLPRGVCRSRLRADPARQPATVVVDRPLRGVAYPQASSAQRSIRCPLPVRSCTRPPSASKMTLKCPMVSTSQPASG